MRNNNKHILSIVLATTALTLTSNSSVFAVNEIETAKKLQEASFEAYDRAFELNPNGFDADLSFNYGMYLKKHHKHERAIEVFDHAIKKRPDFADALHQKGITFRELQKFEESVSELEIAKALKPEDAKIYNSLGRSLASIGKFQEALEEFTKATELDEEFGEAYLNKGYCLEVLGRYEEAAEILKRNTQGTQTESSTRDAGVQASSNMSVVSVQTDSLVIPVTEVATQTHILSSNAEVQTVPTQLSDSFSQTESDSEQARQVEISTSTDDLFVLGAGVSHSDILDWEVASHSSSESDESSYSESVATGSIANARIDEEEEQVLSDESQQILSKDNSYFYNTVAEIDELLASDLEEEEEEEVTHALEDNNNNAFSQRQQELESEKARLASASMELASHSTSNMTGSIISDIDKRLKDAFSLSVVSAGEEEHEQASSIVGGHSGFYISPFIGKTIQQEIASRSGYHSKTRGAIIGYDIRVNDSILLGLNFTKADSKINFRNNKLGDTATLKGNFYSLYGLYIPSDQNIFMSTIGIYGISDIKSSAKRPDSQIATSNHKAYSNIMQVMFGYNYKPISSLSIKPIFGIKYSKIRDASYQEYGAGPYNLALSGTKAKTLETITGLKLSNSSVLASSISITPEIHCFLHKNIKSKNPNITAKFLDEGALLSSGPINRSKLSLRYGAGLNVAAKNLEIGLFYNGNKARKYMSHAGSLKVKINL